MLVLCIFRRFATEIFAHNFLFSLNKWAHLHMIGIKSLLTLGMSGSSSASCLWQTTGHLQGLKCCCPFFLLPVHTKRSYTLLVLRNYSTMRRSQCTVRSLRFRLLPVCHDWCLFLFWCSEKKWFWWQMTNFMKFILSVCVFLSKFFL